MSQQFLTLILAVLLVTTFGCSKDDDRGMSLKEAENQLFTAGVNVEYSVSSTRGGSCLDLYNVEWRAVSRTDTGATQAVTALKQYRQVLLNGRQCVLNPDRTEDLIYRAISDLENCRSFWQNGRRC